MQDVSGAVVPNAKVEIRNPVSGFDRSAVSDSSGRFELTNIPFNPYHLVVTAVGFGTYSQDVEPRSAVPVTISVKLQVAGSTTSVTVEAEGGDLIENDSTFHTDVDKNLFDKLPLESQSSSVSSLVTLSTPGIAADSNGLFHGLGDHAENSFSVDGQPITDQQSKVFSNQIPLDAIQSMEVISGAPPAEYGDKTSVVINVTTQSGVGLTTPHGAVTASYGSFGTSNVGLNLAYGGKSWGNFISASGLNTGDFSIRRSLPSCTTRAMRKIYSIGWITKSRQSIQCISTSDTRGPGFRRQVPTTRRTPRRGMAWLSATVG